MTHRRPVSVYVVVSAVLLAVLTVSGETQQQPTGNQQAPPGGGRGLAGEIALGADFLPRPPVARLTPEQQARLFLLPPGYRIEPVLADPAIQSPVGVSFDGNGRMYILEMRSYMLDADGTDSRAPISRISRHEDTDGDGVYDQHTVFADKLVLPRVAFPLEDGAILVLETDNRDMYKYSDTNGDGVADKKALFYPGAGRVTNMEWQPSGVTWALDNWLYMTYNPFRLRIMPGGKVLREETDINGGQWGSSQDNYGKVWFVDGGGELGPVNFQMPILYGAFNVTDNFEPDFEVPWPAAGGLADMQGGMRRVRLPDQTLNHFTAAAGPEIYRGDRLPQDLVGDLLFEEPVGRIVRRARIVVTDGLTQLRNAYDKSEFVRSTDPLFRPVNMTTGPDGTLYLSDLYSGIIQDAQWVNPGSYLRRKVEQYGLDKHHNWGRIWRITYEGMDPDRRQPRMYAESSAQLVEHLTHSNGWWRDTAQKLLVLRQDKTVVGPLEKMARSSPNQLARIHALWTLEGLGALRAALVREQLRSTDPQLRIQAIRASESLYKAGDRSFAADYRTMLEDGDPNVVIQAMLTLNLHKIPQSADLIQATRNASASRGVREIGSQLLNPQSSQGQRPSLSDRSAFGLNFSAEQRRMLQRGESAYRELCFSCHGADGKGVPMAGAPAGTLMAPPLAGSARVLGHREYVIKVLLNGLTGDLDGRSYAGGVMAPMGGNSDEWLADVASYVRNGFGNSAAVVTPDHVAAVRKATPRRTPWTLPELEATLPLLLTNESEWKATASHNAEAAANGLAGNPFARWDTGVAQQPGMWYQIELPQPTSVTEIQIESSVPFTFPAGGRAGGPGRGEAGRARGPAPGTGAAAAPGPTPAGSPSAAATAAVPAPPNAPTAGRGFGGRGGIPVSGPVVYSVQVSIDGTTWSAPVAQGPGQTPMTVIAFRPVSAKFIRVTQTGTSDSGRGWGIQRVRVYRAGANAQ
jgi:mono/diheme cytochrome c family protein